MQNALPLLQRASPHFSRFVLVLGAALLGTIALRSILDPFAAAARDQMLLQSPFAITVQQVGFGAFPLGAALLAAASLFSREMLRAGLALIAAMVLTALAVRLFAIHERGGLAMNVGPLVGECVLGSLSVVALVLEQLARRRTKV